MLIVRGSKAKDFLASHGITRSVAVITGSVRSDQHASGGSRDIHIVLVGRLSPVKQVGQFITVVDVARRAMPDIRAAIVGDGPLRADLQAHTNQLGLGGCIEFLGQREDVGAFLARSKVFVLTSQSEGLSIAMAEAMAAGAVPVVADVGDLSDLVIDGDNGHLIEPGNIEEYAGKIVALLQDEALWMRFSDRAREAARKLCGIDVVTEKWRTSLRRAVCDASGWSPEGFSDFQLDR